MSNPVLISIVGPTAIGKTALSISLAEHLETEILSADSRQFYREMRIGTAAPTPEELSRVPHHFVQHRSVSDPYSVGDFEKDALKTLERLFQNHRYVILVGGSGLFVEAVTRGLDYFPDVDPQIRENLNVRLASDGIIPLQEELKKVDPVYYSEVDLQNPHRLIRALEVSLGTGRPYSSFRNKKSKTRFFENVLIGLTAPREIVYERINRRVDGMLSQGLLEEVRQLIPKREQNALKTVGYTELFKYFDGAWTLEKAVEEIKKNSRRFAKRQYTWFRKNEDIKWFDYRTPHQEISRYVENRFSTNH